MANNHGADYGAAGLQDSLRGDRGLRLPGHRVSARTRRRPTRRYTGRINGVDVAIVAASQVRDHTLENFSAGADVSRASPTRSTRRLIEQREGREGGRVDRGGVPALGHRVRGLPEQPTSSTLADELAAAGATAVIGTHAHVLQGAGWRPDGVYVAYGLGNYLWWRSFGNDQDDNGVLTLSFDRDTVTPRQLRPVPPRRPRRAGAGRRCAEKRRIAAEFAADRSCTDLAANPPR